MKLLKVSLAASIALGALSTASFAQPLEDAIRGVDVSGYLRYRFNDDRQNFGTAPADKNRGLQAHWWRAQADFKTPTTNNIALNLGLWYNNQNANVNHGKGNSNPAPAAPFLQSEAGTGAGADQGTFGVQSFYATITPDSTATTILAGKQLLNTPVTNAADGDRGTGILALNSDLPGLTLAAGFFDSWAINDGYGLTNPNITNPQINPITGQLIPQFGGRHWNGSANLGSNNTVDENLYVLAGIYSLDTDVGTFGGQLWGFYIDNAVDALIFGELSWKNSLLRAKLQYTYAALNNDDDSVFATLHGIAANSGNKANIVADNDLVVLELGVNTTADFDIPFDARIGYITNFASGTSVALEDEGTNMSRAGKIWWQDPSLGFSTSALRPYGAQAFGGEQTINVFYGALGYAFVDGRLNTGLEFATGTNERKWDKMRGDNKDKADFFEIAPTVSWKHTDQLTLSAFYAYLQESFKDNRGSEVNGWDDKKRQRVRFEARYDF
ncbi:MAG: major outer membrane protein [Helicobacter sp.]|nr:major outer membrane protein [Helicobacter sp.]